METSQYIELAIKTLFVILVTKLAGWIGKWSVKMTEKHEIKTKAKKFINLRLVAVAFGVGAFIAGWYMLLVTFVGEFDSQKEINHVTVLMMLGFLFALKKVWGELKRDYLLWASGWKESKPSN